MSDSTPPSSNGGRQNQGANKPRFAGKLFKGRIPELGVFQTPGERNNANVKQFEQTKEDIIGEIQAKTGKDWERECEEMSLTCLLYTSDAADE